MSTEATSRWMAERDLVLASASPRRRELLTRMGLTFRVEASPAKEIRPQEGLSPREYAEAMAYLKARGLTDRCPQSVILGADTIVASDDRIIGKPSDREEAKVILSSLSGTRHRVLTGVALLEAASHRRLISCETTWVTMRELTDAQLEAYVETGQWEGKAGSYGVQELDDAFVEKVEGSFDNVVGLPTELLGNMLTAFARMLEEPPPGSPPRFRSPSSDSWHLACL